MKHGGGMRRRRTIRCTAVLGLLTTRFDVDNFSTVSLAAISRARLASGEKFAQMPVCLVGGKHRLSHRLLGCLRAGSRRIPAGWHLPSSIRFWRMEVDVLLVVMRRHRVVFIANVSAQSS